MTERLPLSNALAGAKIERPAAERIATEIFDAIRENVATKHDLLELEHRLTIRFASVMVVLTGIVIAAIRYLPPAH